MSKKTKCTLGASVRFVRRALAMLSAFAFSCALLPAVAFASPGQLTADSPLQSGGDWAVALSTQASAVKSAKKTTKKSAAFTIKKYGRTERYAYATGKWAYGKPIIKGNSKVVKKINKSLNKRYTEYRKTLGSFLGYAKSETRPMSMLNTYTTKATYNSKGYVSFRYSSEWFAGGVFNSDVMGDTYSLKTGKKLNVSQVVSGNVAQVKNKIANAFVKKYSLDGTYSAITSKKISEFEFYLQNGNVIVVAEPYTWPGQRSALTVKLKGNYA